MLDKKAQGKKNRRDGANFEKAVRKELESQDWIVSKWVNQVEFKFIELKDCSEGKLVPAKSNRFNMRTCGFPDFLAFQSIERSGEFFTVIGVEAKSNGYLDKEEKSKCKWLLENKIFSKILIASKDKENNKKISYKEFSF